ncbi:hypothetical protein N0M98_21775 [Paenibacillus doosanensis]|nr:hypothetical protein [Paenibacillus doosanensis]
MLVSACSKQTDQAGTASPTPTPDTSQQTQSPAPSPTPTPTPAAQDSNNNKSADQGQTKENPPVEAPKGAAEQPVVTTDQYSKVDFGMSFDDVTKTMGQMGKLISEAKAEDGSNPVQTYEYKLKDGGSAKITFRNGKVTSKSDSSK